MAVGRRVLAALALLGALAVWPPATLAEPRRPGDDTEVLERVAARRADPAVQALQALRERQRAAPQDPALAVALVRALVQRIAADGDPRHAGHAQAALAPWWNQPDPPPAVRVQRAVLLQFNHGFDAALADLDAALRADPADAEALAWQLAIRLVRADYAGARASCDALSALAGQPSAGVPPLLAVACRAQVDAATGRAAPAAAALRAALDARRGADPALRLWALTRLGETEQRLGRAAAAEASFREALALGRDDVYLQAALADLLLEQGRAADAWALLAGRGRADALLLRQALAAKALGRPEAPALVAELEARFAAARRRGDGSHAKEEAMHALHLRGDAARALALARDNYALQREAADARILLQAALAARDAAAAQPALRWLGDSGFEDVALRALATRVEALR